jgi:hypothetical protein
VKVFICWSEERSKAMAEALRDWLPDVIQAIDPWISSRDIETGARWYVDLTKQLEKTQIGIVCITADNLESPWIYFESGSVAKKLDDNTRLCPYLLDLEIADLTGPLAHFQAGKADKEGTKQIVQTINRNLGQDALPDDRLERAFDIQWPRLEDRLKKIRESAQPATKPMRSQKDMVEEILITVREHSRILSAIRPEVVNPDETSYIDMSILRAMYEGDMDVLEWSYHNIREISERLQAKFIDVTLDFIQSRLNMLKLKGYIEIADIENDDIQIGDVKLTAQGRDYNKASRPLKSGTFGTLK